VPNFGRSAVARNASSPPVVIRIRLCFNTMFKFTLNFGVYVAVPHGTMDSWSGSYSFRMRRLWKLWRHIKYDISHVTSSMTSLYWRAIGTVLSYLGPLLHTNPKSLSFWDI